MKKRVFIAFLAAVHIVILWAVLFAVDYSTVMKLSDPVIAQHVGAEGGIFKGPGWTVQIEKYHTEDCGWVTESVEMYLFGKLVGAAVT